MKNWYIAKGRQITYSIIGFDQNTALERRENSLAIKTMAEQIPLTKICERFGNLRIINPQADRAMLRSMEKYGQMAPVVVSRMEQDHYELLDGFKRLRAGKELSLPSLNARILNLDLRAAKVAVMPVELDRQIDQQHGRGPGGAFPLS